MSTPASSSPTLRSIRRNGSVLPGASARRGLQPGVGSALGSPLATGAASMLLVGLTMFFGCGGSGSSGFSRAAERAVLAGVLESGLCEDFDELTYCPADQNSDTGNPRTIDTPFGEVPAFLCTVEAGDPNSCHFAFTFLGAGFTDSEHFAVAVRGFDADEPWMVRPAAVIGVPNGDAKGAARGVTPAIVDRRVQIVVLSSDRPFPSGATEVERLRDIGTQNVFVISVQQPEQVASVSEDELFETVTDFGECQMTGVTQICPLNAVLPGSGFELLLNLPPLIQETEVSAVSEAGFVSICALNTEEGLCTIAENVTLRGIAASSARLAARVTDGAGTPTGPWVLSETMFAGGTDSSSSGPGATAQFLFKVDVPGLDNTVPTSPAVFVQTAVLVDPLPGPKGEQVSTLGSVAGVYTFIGAEQVVEPVVP